MDCDQLIASRMLLSNAHLGNGGYLGPVTLRTKTLDLGAHQLPTPGSYEVADLRRLQKMTGHPLSLLVHDAWLVVDYQNPRGTTLTFQFGVNGSPRLFMGTHAADSLGLVGGSAYRLLKGGGDVNFAAGEVAAMQLQPPAGSLTINSFDKVKSLVPGVVTIAYESGVGPAGEPITGFARGYLVVSLVDLDNGEVL